MIHWFQVSSTQFIHPRIGIGIDFPQWNLSTEWLISENSWIHIFPTICSRETPWITIWIYLQTLQGKNTLSVIFGLWLGLLLEGQRGVRPWGKLPVSRQHVSDHGGSAGVACSCGGTFGCFQSDPLAPNVAGSTAICNIFLEGPGGKITITNYLPNFKTEFANCQKWCIHNMSAKRVTH